MACHCDLCLCMAHQFVPEVHRRSYGVCDEHRHDAPVQVYMHLVDPTRDRHLMNKSADVLVRSCGVPPCWYNPVPNKGLSFDPDTGLVESERERAKERATKKEE